MGDLDLEKGFNEAELEDIMSEIESLEKDFGDLDAGDSVIEAFDEPSEEPVMEEDQMVEEEPMMDEEPVMEEDPVYEEEKREIESMLETEFEAVESISPSEELAVDPESIEKSAIQSEIEDEVEAIIEEVSEPVSEAFEEPVMMEEQEAPVAEHFVEEPVQPEGEVVEMSTIEKPVKSLHSHESRMEFSVAGDMKLKLNFWINGQSVALHVDEEEGFCIEMEGGAKFSLPVGKKAA